MLKSVLFCCTLCVIFCKYSQFTLYSTIYSVSENLCVETCNSNNGNFLKFLCFIRISPYTYKGKNSELLQLYNVQYCMYIYCWWWCWCAVPGGWSGWGRGSRPRPPPPSLLHPPLLPHQPRIWAFLSIKKHLLICSVFFLIYVIILNFVSKADKHLFTCKALFCIFL